MNKKIIYMILTIILMFINIGICYARPNNDYELAFVVSNFSNPSFDEIMKAIDEKYPDTTPSYWLYIEENEMYMPLPAGTTYTNIRFPDSDILGETSMGTVTKIAFHEKDDAKTIYKTLKQYSIWDSIYNSYCQSPADNDAKNLCKKIEAEVDNTTTTPNDKGNTCDYNFKNTELGESFSFSIYINETKDGMNAFSNDSNVTGGSESFVYIKANNSTKTLFYYEKGSSYSSFKENYLLAYKNQTNVNEHGCPILYLLKDKKNDWYTTLNKELCEQPPMDTYASGTCQTTSGGKTDSYTYFDAPNFDSLIGEKNTVDSCEDLIPQGGDLQKLLKGIVSVVRILVPIALLALGTLDFAQAIFSSNEDAMKKAQSKFMRRLLIAAVIFLIAPILKVILTIAHGIWPVISSDLCGIL